MEERAGSRKATLAQIPANAPVPMQKLFIFERVPSFFRSLTEMPRKCERNAKEVQGNGKEVQEMR